MRYPRCTQFRTDEVPRPIAPDLSELLHVTRALEGELAALGDALQQEGRTAAMGDLIALIAVRRRRATLVRAIQDQAASRQAAFERAWRTARLQSVRLPNNVPSALRLLARAWPARAEDLRESAARLDVLFDVIHELQGLSRTLCRRALSNDPPMAAPTMRPTIARSACPR